MKRIISELYGMWFVKGIETLWMRFDESWSLQCHSAVEMKMNRLQFSVVTTIERKSPLREPPTEKLEEMKVWCENRLKRAILTTFNTFLLSFTSAYWMCICVTPFSTLSPLHILNSSLYAKFVSIHWQYNNTQ